MPERRDVGIRGLGRRYMDAGLFYSQCLEEFHACAAEAGLAKRGVIYAPDLMPMGEKAVTSYYGDAALAAGFAADPTGYYYTVCSSCLQCGVLFASLYASDPLALTDAYVDTVISMDPWQLAERHVKERLRMNREGMELFSAGVFDRWIDLVEPYYEKPESAVCIYYATLAMFQLGVSLIAGAGGKNK